MVQAASHNTLRSSAASSAGSSEVEVGVGLRVTVSDRSPDGAIAKSGISGAARPAFRSAPCWLQDYGAASTWRQAGGSCFMSSGGLGLGGNGEGLGWTTDSWNHQSSSLPQPSPLGGTGSCGLHSGLPAGQKSRTWKRSEE